MKYKNLILKNIASLTTDVKKNRIYTKKEEKTLEKEYRFLKNKNNSWFNKI
ncbi:hypothetical protein [Lactobacillus sp. ESL0259]|uniref:hypothetical protein n=1 Tax=Lactobacillus sp. ESL0259 TaxID=2069346 RepID=UPI001313DA97|nr:hypothetical protein [Lactobacillus sp. ESL0259]